MAAECTDTPTICSSYSKHSPAKSSLTSAQQTFAALQRAIDAVGITSEESTELFRAMGIVLLLGELEYETSNINDAAVITNKDVVERRKARVEFLCG